jgi:hypothetical protein
MADKRATPLRIAPNGSIETGKQAPAQRPFGTHPGLTNLKYAIEVIEGLRFIGMDQNPKGVRDMLSTGCFQVEMEIHDKDVEIARLRMQIEKLISDAAWEASARHAERSGGTL